MSKDLGSDFGTGDRTGALGNICEGIQDFALAADYKDHSTIYGSFLALSCTAKFPLRICREVRVSLPVAIRSDHGPCA